MFDLSPRRNELEPIELASRDEIAGLQLQRLKWSLRHAYENVPHYRKKFAAANVHPDDLKSLSDLAKFPFTTKQDLRDTYPFGMFATPMEKVARIHASSGTTGMPIIWVCECSTVAPAAEPTFLKIMPYRNRLSWRTLARRC